MNVEDEICLFVRLTPFTIGKLNEMPYDLMVQGDLNTTSKEGLRVTNRVRMTKEGDKPPVFTTATKFRLPRKSGSVSTKAPQVEFDIEESDFNTVMGACESRYVKRRYSVKLSSGVTVEIDRYMENSNEFSKYAKIDIENADETQLDIYLSELKDRGIHFAEIINPPGVENDSIKANIDELMGKTWNLAR
jgi:CYTH domain-containing protein